MRGLIIAVAICAALAGMWFGVSAIFEDDQPIDPIDAPAVVAKQDDAPETPDRGAAETAEAPKPATAPAPKPMVVAKSASRDKPRKPVDPTRFQVVSTFQDIPIEGATVSALDARGKVVGDPATSDANGQFDLPSGWQSGSLRIQMTGFATADFAVQGDRLVGDGTSNDRLLRLAPAGVIQGTVFDPERKPLAWAKVTVSALIDDGYGELLAVRCDTGRRLFTKNGGAYRVEGLDPRGRYLVIASLARLGITAVKDVRAVPDAPATDIVIGGQSDVSVSLEDPKGERIFGARATLVGRPDDWPGAVIADDVSRGYAALMKQNVTRLERTAFSGRDPVRFTSGVGFYFPSIPPGTYQLEILAKGYRTVSQRITVSAGKNLSTQIRLAPAEVALTGTITGGDGLPVSGAQLSVLTDGSSFGGYRNAASKADGSFAIRGPKEWKQPLQVTIQATGYGRVMRRVPSGQRRLDVKLLKNGVVTGSVQMENRPEGPIVLEFVRSKPVPRIERRRFESRLQWKRYRFDLPPGMWSVRMTAPGFRDHLIKSFEIRPGIEVQLGDAVLGAK